MRTVILLHGALGCKSHWDHVLPHLDKGLDIHNLNFPLHGGEPASKTELGLKDLSSYVEAYVKEHQLTDFSIVGYSMGGYIGLYLAIRQMPGLNRLVTLGTKLNWSTPVAEEEISRIGLENLAPIHAKLEQEHGRQWQDVVAATHSIMRSIGKDPIRKEQMKDIKIPVFLLLGERDKMVTADETIQFAGEGSSCHYEIIPGQPHLLEKVDGSLIGGKINALLAGKSSI